MILRAIRWALQEIREKLDVRGTFREIVAMGKKYGTRFLVFAILWEIIEDVVFPAIAVYNGMPELVAFFLVFHFEPITYPAALWAFHTWDRMQGLEAWDPPNRVNTSTLLRTVAKNHIYTMITIVVFSWAVFSYMTFAPGTMFAVAFFMVWAFGFIHERIWNDQNYGIDPVTDLVDPHRTVMKALTYHFVTTLLLGSFLHAMGHIPVTLLMAGQAISLLLYWAIETAWSKSLWGLRPAES